MFYRGGYDTSRGGGVSPRGRGDYDVTRGRGRYDASRLNGEYDASRGRGGFGPSRGRGGYDASRESGEYDASRGRGRYDTIRGNGEYDSRRGRGGFGPSRGRGGYDASRESGEYDASRGRGRGGYDASRESGEYDASRGRGRYDTIRGNGTYDSRRGRGDTSRARGGYDASRGISSGGERGSGSTPQYKCLASQFKIIIGEKSYAHNYEVEIIHQLGNEDRIISKKCERQLNRHLVNEFCEFNGISVVYDGMSQLWSNQLLEEPLEFVCAAAEFDDFMKSKLRQEGSLLIKVKHVGEVDLTNFDQYFNTAESHGERRTQRNVCELILSSSAINRGEYTFSGIGSLFETKEIPFQGTGIVTREGNSKGVHIIEWDKKPQLIMSLEYSNKLFYPGGQFLLTFVDNLVNNGWTMDDLVKLLCGLKLSLTYNPSRIITFDGFSDEPVDKLRIGMVSMEEFFQQRWHVQLHRVDTLAVIAKSYDNNKYDNVEKFPIETLVIVADQSVPAERLPKSIHEKSLEINRLKTDDRYQRIMKQHEKMKFNANDSLCQAFGLYVESEMISGPFSRLPKSVVLVRNNQHLTVKDDGSFSFERNQYLIPAHIRCLTVLASKSNQRKSMESIDYIKKEAIKKGMRIDEVQYVEFNTYSTSFTDWVEALRNRKNEFVVVVDDNSDSHALLKISAAINRVSTQHIHFDTAKLVSTGGRGMTRENIVHQLNIKSFGLNHKALFDHDIVNLNLDKENVFVIGLDVCHPTGNNFRGATVVPSTVGIVGNYLENPNSFAGTFFYQRPRQEFVDPFFLHVSVKKMLQRNPRVGKINTIVILRDGVSEGQYAKILDTEVAAVKKCSTEIFGHPNTRIVCIIVTKNGNARHFDMTYKHPQSLPPRSVVTFGCRFQFNQFYIVPHRAFQGTAKAIMVTVIQDDVGCEAIEIQKFILALTNLHQIVCSPISLPEPVYLSDSLAQRGYEVFSTYSTVCSNQIRRDEKGHMKLQELSYDLGFNFENSQ